MKRLEDIERLSLEELERISEDGRVAVPDGLGERLENTLAAAGMLRKQKPSHSGTWKFSSSLQWQW